MIDNPVVENGKEQSLGNDNYSGCFLDPTNWVVLLVFVVLSACVGRNNESREVDRTTDLGSQITFLEFGIVFEGDQEPTEEKVYYQWNTDELRKLRMNSDTISFVPSSSEFQLARGIVENMPEKLMQQRPRIRKINRPGDEAVWALMAIFSDGDTMQVTSESTTSYSTFNEIVWNAVSDLE